MMLLVDGMGFRGKSFGPVIIYRADDYLEMTGGLLCLYDASGGLGWG
jgi:hypothetical protein